MRKLFILFAAMLAMASASAETLWYYSSLAKGVYSTDAGACRANIPANNSSESYTFGRVNISTTTGSRRCIWNLTYLEGLDKGKTVEQAAGSLLGTYDDATACPAGKVRTEGVYPPACGTAPVTGPQCATPAGKQFTFTVASGTSKSPTADTSDPGTDPSGAGFPTTSPTCGLQKGSLAIDNCFSRKNATGGQDFFCTYTGTSDGTNAPAGTTPASDAKPGAGTTPAKDTGSADTSGNCPRGSVQGGVDSGGTPICIGTGTNPTNGSTSTKDQRPTTGSTKTTTDAAGNTIQTQTSTQQNGDGSSTTTTTTTTTAPDGSKSISGSTSTSMTGDGKQGVPDPDTKDFCTQHPELTACKNSSVSGSCAQVACNGDAIQCATLQQAAALRCSKDDDDKALKASSAFALGQSVMNGTDPSAASLPTNKNAIGVSVPALNSSGWLGAGGCFPNKTFTVQGRTITISFSEACNVLIALRYALMVIASLVAFKIVRGAFLSE